MASASGTMHLQLLAMAARVHGDAEDSFTKVQVHWLDGRYSRFNRRVAAFGRKLTRV